MSQCQWSEIGQALHHFVIKMENLRPLNYISLFFNLDQGRTEQRLQKSPPQEPPKTLSFFIIKIVSNLINHPVDT